MIDMYEELPIFGDNLRDYDKFGKWNEVNIDAYDIIGSWNKILNIDVNSANEYIRHALRKPISSFKLEVELRLVKLLGNTTFFVLGNASDLSDAGNTICSIVRSAENTIQVKDENETNQIGSNITIIENKTWINFKIIQWYFGKTDSTGLIQVWYKFNNDKLWTYLGARNVQSEELTHIGIGGLDAGINMNARNLMLWEIVPNEVKNISI